MTGSKKLCQSWEAARYSNGLAGTDQNKFTFIDEICDVWCLVYVAFQT